MNSRHWWNGRWSRLTRRDVFVRSSVEGGWAVELRRGGPGGRSRTRSFDAESDAVGWVQRMLVDVDAGWREVPPATDAPEAVNVASASKIAC